MKDYKKIAIELGQTLISKAPETREDVERMLPELKESEDERIRKALKEYFINSFQNNGVAAILGVHIKDILIWLENQGEQKPADKVEPKFKVGDEIIRSSKNSCPVHSSTDDTICKVAEIHDTCYILDTKEGKIQVPFEWQDYYELFEQNPAWSEEDEENESALISLCLASAPESWTKYAEWLKGLKYRVVPQITPEWNWKDEKTFKAIQGLIAFYENDYRDEYLEWFKSIKDRVQPQPKSEWSEEDKALIYNIEQDYKDKLNNNPPESLRPYYNKVISWLKSLRPQSHWKPTKEQIKALSKAWIECDNKEQSTLLSELLEHLKALYL